MAKLLMVKPVLMSRNIIRSTEFYKRLGFTVCFQDAKCDPKYIGVTRNGIELHIQWHDEREWDLPNDRPTYRFTTDNVDDLYNSFVAAGITDIKKPWATNWDTYEFHVRDPDVNGLQFYTTEINKKNLG